MSPESKLALLEEYMHSEVRTLIEAQINALRLDIMTRLTHRNGYPELCHLQGQIAGLDACLKAPAQLIQKLREGQRND